MVWRVKEPYSFDHDGVPVSVRAGSRQVGQVTTAVWSPRHGANLAFAMLDRDAWMPGSTVEIECPGHGARRGQVVTLPFTGASA